MRRKSTNARIFPLLLVGFGALLLLGSVIVYFNSAQDASLVEIPTQTAAMAPYPQVKRVSLSDAKAAFDIGNAIFIDTRGEPYYSQGHIPGSLSITDSEILSNLDQFSQDDWIITYCTAPAEESSARVAQLLLDNGFSKAMPLQGGLEVWAAAGYPLEK